MTRSVSRVARHTQRAWAKTRTTVLVVSGLGAIDCGRPPHAKGGQRQATNRPQPTAGR